MSRRDYPLVRKLLWTGCDVRIQPHLPHFRREKTGRVIHVYKYTAMVDIGKNNCFHVPHAYLERVPMKPPHANFVVLERTHEQITIRDIGPWDQHRSVTNDAEEVIRRLAPEPNQKVFCFGSDNQLDELVHHDGKFVQFKLLGHAAG